MQFTVSGGLLGGMSTSSVINLTPQVPQYDNVVASHRHGRLVREASLLQECLQLYFEPRLLRIQPVETLDLRALAFLISASTTINPCTNILNAPSELKDSSSIGPLYGTENGDVMDQNRQLLAKADMSQAPITLRELNQVIEGGNYFLKHLKKELSKWEDKPSDLKQTDITSSSGTCIKSETAPPLMKSNPPKEEERSELENLCRDRLHDRIYFTVLTVSCRLDMCMKMLRVASGYNSNKRKFNTIDGDFMFNAANEVDSTYPTMSANVPCPIECSKNVSSPCFDRNDEILQIDDALETAFQGIYIKDHYAYVRFKNLLLKYCKNFPKDINMNFLPENTLKRLTSRGYFQTSMDETQRYCWCRGIDDGRPMVQCDGCDEWFHSACMGLCNTSTSGNKKLNQRNLRCTLKRVEFEPPYASCSTVTLDNYEVSGQSIDIPQKNSIKEKIIRKRKTKFTHEKRTLEEINEKVSSSYFCIACAEDREKNYAFAWTTDNS